ncbi:MAG: alpha-L-fucosidase [Chitinophagaceae bacterium]|nr:alpha-L-fucosidase [Chitinophagaceae bacterium]
MRKLLSSILIFCSPVCMSQQSPERFAGLHFDFHASMKDSSIGKTFTVEMIDSLLTIAGPDFIQVDCKGHPGVSSYPTKVGTHAPTLQKDILKIWREVTAKHKVPLYVHYSGVWDSMAIVKNPSWARIEENGKPSLMATSVFSRYVEDLVIPQVKELATEYKVDGIWVDGDCWTMHPDYSEEAMSRFRKETGIAEVPRKITDSNYYAWMEFNRKAFVDYIARYANAAHEAAPGFKVTSNWSFSSMMPEPVSVPVDYLSGDVAGINGVYSSLFESRCLAHQGKPWDLMSWSFAWKDNSKATKSIPQILQEASEVLAMGGGYQTYWQQNSDGSPEPYQFRKMERIIKFCRDRKAYTFKGEIVPQIGLLYSGYAWRRIPSSSLYLNSSGTPMKGVLNMIADSRLPVDILMDHHLEGRMEKYPLLVIPEWNHIDPQIRTRLLEYVKNGGNLLVIGASGVQDFKKELGVEFHEPLIKNNVIYAGLNGRIVMMKTDYQSFEPTAGSLNIGTRLSSDDWRFTTKDHLASIHQLGKGKIAGIFIDMGAYYTRYQNALSLELLQNVISSMVPAFISTIKSAEGSLHQAVTRKSGNLYIHLINTNGPHNNPNVLVYEDVLPVKNVTLEINLPVKPTTIRLQPGNQKVPFVYKDGKASVTLPEVPIYSILEIPGS